MPVKGWVPNRTSLMQSACERCGTTSQLNLHHNDRDRSNNSAENLQTLCAPCHTRWHWAHDKKPKRRHSPTCTVCGKPARRLGLCETHRSRYLRHGSPYLVKRKIGSSWVLVEEPGTPNGQESVA